MNNFESPKGYFQRLEGCECGMMESYQTDNLKKWIAAGKSINDFIGQGTNLRFKKCIMHQDKA